MSFATDAQRTPKPFVDDAPPSEIAEDIAETAKRLVNCSALDPRDRNAAIGMLRNAAAFIRGADGLAGFKQAQFTPTTR